MGFNCKKEVPVCSGNVGGCAPKMQGSKYRGGGVCGWGCPPLYWGRSLHRGILIKLSLCYGIVYYYNGAQRYEQFLQVIRLYLALILLGLALCLPSTSVSSIFIVLYRYLKKILLTSVYTF